MIVGEHEEGKGREREMWRMYKRGNENEEGEWIGGNDFEDMKWCKKKRRKCVREGEEGKVKVE